MLIEPIDTILSTIELSPTAEIILTATETTVPTAEVLSEATDVVLDQSTAEMTPLPLPDLLIILPTPEASVTMLPSQTLIATATFALRTVEGKALYPNRVLGQAFIRVQAFAPDNTLLNTVYTDANGRYSLVVAADQVTRVEIEAPLYLPETLYLVPSITPEPLTLRGGDLDSNGCVGKADIDILVGHYGEVFVGADLDGSGIIDVIDLTLLSGNYDDTCVTIVIISTSTSPVFVATAESISTEDVSGTEFPVPTDSLLTQEALPTVELSAPDTPTLPTEAVPLSEVIAEATLQL